MKTKRFQLENKYNPNEFLIDNQYHYYEEWYSEDQPVLYSAEMVEDMLNYLHEENMELKSYKENDGLKNKRFNNVICELMGDRMQTMVLDFLWENYRFNKACIKRFDKILDKHNVEKSNKYGESWRFIE